MAQELPRRTGFSGPALIRLLVSLNDADILEPAQSISDRLSQWLGWSEAIAWLRHWGPRRRQFSPRPPGWMRNGNITVSGKYWATRSPARSEEHTSELQSLMRTSYA